MRSLFYSFPKFAVSFFFLLFIGSCSEDIPAFSKKSLEQIGDTTYIETTIPTPDRKQVVMEEFTGVNCVNCPQGSQLIKNIVQTFPGQIIEIGLHSAFLSETHSTSKQDLRTAEAEQLSQYFIDPGYKPAAAIDRFVFDSNNPSVQYDRNSWLTYVGQRVAQVAPVNVLVTTLYNTNTRELTATVETHFTKVVTGKIKLTVLLAEDSIETSQLDAGNVIREKYIHRNVQRSFLTPYDGLPLSNDAEPGRVYRRSFKTTLPLAPVEWQASKMHVIAFLHRFEGSKEVLQGAEVAVQ